MQRKYSKVCRTTMTPNIVMQTSIQANYITYIIYCLYFLLLEYICLNRKKYYSFLNFYHAFHSTSYHKTTVPYAQLFVVGAESDVQPSDKCHPRRPSAALPSEETVFTCNVVSTSGT